MTFSIAQFHSLREHATATMQTPTGWMVDVNAHIEITMNAKFGEYRASLDPATPMRFLGLDVIVDPDLPPNRVVMKSGDNTVGAFTIGIDDQEPKDGD